MGLKLGVIFGGQSVEHEVSIITAIQAMEHINKEKYEIIPIYIGKNNEWYTGHLLKDINSFKDFSLIKKYIKRVILYKNQDRFILQTKGFFKREVAELDIVFPIVHGTNVEDGILQGYLETIGIPYVGSNVYASVVGQDKVFMKQIFEASKIPVVKYLWFFDNEYYEKSSEIKREIKKLEYPVIVKPATLGSSIGISIVEDEKDIDKAIELAIEYDKKIIVEEVVKNLLEVNCSVLGSHECQETSQLEEIINKESFLSFEDKYIGNGNKLKGAKTRGLKSMEMINRYIPARINNELTEAIKTTSKEVFRVLNSSGVCRIDYLIDKKANKYYVSEINSIPGSLSYYLWLPVGKSYEQLLDEAISVAIKQYKRKQKKVYSFENNVLANFDGIKGKIR